MKRLLITQLLSWRDNVRRKPLILKGVRQAGKTHLLQEFGNTNYKQTHYINCEKQESIKEIFENDLDPKRILTDLQFSLQTKINIQEDLLIIDEIQACPRALTSLKYFCEELPELNLCSAGSLLGLHLNQGSYPVGKVDMLHLYPMSFYEFLLGIGDEIAAGFISNFTLNTKITDTIHQQLWLRLKQYFITGGLPEVVSVFSEYQENLYEASISVRQKQEELIKAYYADIAKHAGKINAMHIDRTWRSVPTQLSKTHDDGTKRFKFKDIIPNINRYSQLVNVIDWLESAELLIKIPIIETIEMPLSAYAKNNLFKLFMFDTGILGAMSELGPKNILDQDYGTYKGYFAENFVAQQLQSIQKQRFYSWQKDRSEIEFLLQHEGSVIPIEVKSGKSTRAQSLQKYIKKYSPEKTFVLSANKPNVNLKSGFYQLPLYLCEKILDLD